MNIKKIMLLAFLTISFISITSCGKQNTNYEGQTKVLFELEGGTYKNSTETVTYYYPLEDNQTCRIFDINTFDDGKNKVSNGGFTFTGWYKTKTIDSSGKTTYSDLWDFNNDFLTTAGLTLYAKWEKIYTYSYEVMYRDEQGALVSLGKYNVLKGSTFSDSQNFASKRTGYTPISFEDEKGNPWDESFTHPGGDENVCIPVIANYIEGIYDVVRTKADFISYSSRRTSKMYLLNDIDLEGESISFGNFIGKVIGNGHTVSNFAYKYTSRKSDLVQIEGVSGTSLVISLFGNMKNAEISNVTFDNVSIVIETENSSITGNVFVSSLASSMENTNINDVSINGTYQIKTLPQSILDAIEERVVFELSSGYVTMDELSVITNFNTNFTEVLNENN